MKGHAMIEEETIHWDSVVLWNLGMKKTHMPSLTCVVSWFHWNFITIEWHLLKLLCEIGVERITYRRVTEICITPKSALCALWRRCLAGHCLNHSLNRSSLHERGGCRIRWLVRGAAWHNVPVVGRLESMTDQGWSTWNVACCLTRRS